MLFETKIFFFMFLSGYLSSFHIQCDAGQLFVKMPLSFTKTQASSLLMWINIPVYKN